jgi:hypothetical protein
MISRPPTMRIQHSMVTITSFYHASVESHPANRSDFFNTHRPLHFLRIGRRSGLNERYGDVMPTIKS